MAVTSRLLVQYIKDATVATFTDTSVVDMQHIENIRRELDDMVENQNKTRLVLDMSKITHLSSSALGVLIPLGQKVKKLKGKLVLCGVRPEIRKVFKITKLEKHFTFCATEADSLSELGVSTD